MARTMITTEEAARRANRTERTIRRWQERGLLGRFKTGSGAGNLVDAAELRRLLEPKRVDRKD